MLIRGARQKGRLAATGARLPRRRGFPSPADQRWHRRPRGRSRSGSGCLARPRREGRGSRRKLGTPWTLRAIRRRPCRDLHRRPATIFTQPVAPRDGLVGARFPGRARSRPRWFLPRRAVTVDDDVAQSRTAELFAWPRHRPAERREELLQHLVRNLTSRGGDSMANRGSAYSGGRTDRMPSCRPRWS